MKRILMIVILLFVGYTSYGQEYFIQKYNTIISGNEVLSTETYVEFNVYNSTDIVVHFATEEPVRYVQYAEPEAGEYRGLSYQLALMRLAGKSKIISFALFETGELIMFSVEDEKSIILTNDPNVKEFKKIR